LKIKNSFNAFDTTMEVIKVNVLATYCDQMFVTLSEHYTRLLLMLLFWVLMYIHGLFKILTRKFKFSKTIQKPIAISIFCNEFDHIKQIFISITSNWPGPCKSDNMNLVVTLTMLTISSTHCK
jgi:hypothetical protein